MAENDRRGAMPFLAILAGGLVVAVIVVGFFMYTGDAGYGGHTATAPSHLSLNVKLTRHP